MSKPTRQQHQLGASAGKTAVQPSARQTGARPAPPPAYRPQSVPKVLQRKAAAAQPPPSGATRRPPVAPPPYRPQPRVSQAKTAAPAAPPAYRPQPTPKVLQRKAATPQPARVGGRAAASPAAPVARPAPKPFKPGASAAVRNVPPSASVAQAKKLPGGAGVIQRAQLGPLPAAWPDSVRAGEHTLQINRNKNFVLYSNDNLVSSGHAGSLHCTIHNVAPTSDRNTWDPSANTLEGRLYVTKKKQVGAEIVNDVATEKGGNYDQSNPEEYEAMQKLKGYLEEIYLQLRPFRQAPKDAHIYHTTMHNSSIPL